MIFLSTAVSDNLTSAESVQTQIPEHLMSNPECHLQVSLQLQLIHISYYLLWCIPIQSKDKNQTKGKKKENEKVKSNYRQRRKTVKQNMFINQNKYWDDADA